ncbi:molybdenum cofactor guanylyltransferase [Paenibacillus sp. NPDC056579]|uniref:molybdenum cofactor guanylyltransferase n=1 Tax=unclassified Paenibacillus TaxID=185978 RepID=UPI001EF79CBC|nr:NTP transferase domain-containing protein [Paenibacillus sp. H1-7]ULL17497.1 molybdenum cofactor guanylyltransferase [Paenibacillus sp. H1-7]
MLSGVILAGGERGITDSLQRIGSETLIESRIREMQTVCHEIIVVTNEPRALLPVVPRSTRILTDYLPGYGVISGLHAAFTLSRYNHLWVHSSSGVPPAVSIARLAWKLYEIKLTSLKEAVILKRDSAPIPLFGVYSRACLKVITDLIEEGDSRITELLSRIAWEGVDGEAIADELRLPASSPIPLWQHNQAF